MRKFVLFALLLTLCLTAACVKGPSLKTDFPLGKTFTDSIVFRGMTLPLPEGEWEVVGRGNGYNRKFDELILGIKKGDKPHKILALSRESSTNKYYGYYSNKYLSRENVLYTDVVSNKRDEGQDGWLINHLRLSFSESDTEAYRQSLEYIKSNKLVMPGNVIEVYHRFTGKHKKNVLLDYSYIVNPEAEGFAPPKNAEWASSDWNVLKINNDPKKVAYIDKLKKEQAEFHKELRAAFGSL